MELVITLLVVGAVLVFAEGILPGMVAGIAGLCCLLAGIIAAYMRYGAQTGSLILVAVLIILVIGFYLWIKYLPQSRLARSLVSKKVTGEIGTERPELLDHTGTALSPLRPAGTVLIDGKRVDVVTEGQMIDPGTKVRVVAVEGMRVVVRGI